jgi:hypothetical protein
MDLNPIVTGFFLQWSNKNLGQFMATDVLMYKRDLIQLNLNSN